MSAPQGFKAGDIITWDMPAGEFVKNYPQKGTDSEIIRVHPDSGSGGVAYKFEGGPDKFFNYWVQFDAIPPFHKKVEDISSTTDYKLTITVANSWETLAALVATLSEFSTDYDAIVKFSQEDAS